MDRLNDRANPVAIDRQRNLRILLSAYACEPDKGSEPGIGWRWALNLSESGHDVHVITRSNNRDDIEAALRRNPVQRLSVAYYDLPVWARWWKRGGRGVYLYYLLWQWGAFLVARKLCRHYRFDIVHHITFGVFRQPSFMAFLGVPFVFGPVGGGERAPHGLRRSFPLSGKLKDFLRDVANAAVKIDPIMHGVFSRSAVILCKTRETLEAIPSRYRTKCQVQLEIGTSGVVTSAAHDNDALRLLYVGRLVYLKGVHLALRAFAKLLERHPDVRFTIVGSGPEQPRLQKLADQLGVQHAVDWVPWLARSEVLGIYSKHDVLLFPSLHDSSGNVVLEALANGTPVVCLNLGGPGVLVDDRCGIRVDARDEREAIAGLSDALRSLAEDRQLCRRMGKAATARALGDFSWRHQTEKMNRIYAAIAPRAEIAPL